MNKALSDLVRRALKPAYLLLATCLVIYLSATGTIIRLEHQAAPAIVELKGAAIEGYGITSFAREYLADPFGKAIGLSERQLQLCRQVASIVPAYESTQGWRNTALVTGMVVLLILAYPRWGPRAKKMAGDFKRRMNLAATQVMLRRMMADASGRMSKMQRKSPPMKGAIVSVIISCPACQQELRVPTGKGRLRISCSACGNKFETTT